MLQNYLKIALRNLWRNKVFSLINIFGLSSGLCVCLLIVLFVQDEISFDDFHTKADRIVLFQQFENGSGSGSGFAQLIQSGSSQAEAVVRLVKANPLIGNTTQSFYEKDFYFADSTLFAVFDFPLVQGDTKKALAIAGSVLISQRMAQKYFPNQNPLGKTLTYQTRHKLTVTGVFGNLPGNSHIAVDFLGSFSDAARLTGQNLDGYWDGASLTYVLLSPGTQAEAFAKTLPLLAKKTNDANAGVWKPDAIPLREIYLHHRLDGRVRAVKAVENVYIFSVVALLVLVLACLNYISLSSARATLRAREVGVRKVTGASRRQLFGQFLLESALFTFIGWIMALVLARLALPFFNALAQKQLSLGTLLSLRNLLVFGGMMAAVTLLTGSYPALVLSSFRPIEVLKSVFFRHSDGNRVRKVLVVSQFSVSIAMIIATLVALSQLRFIHSKQLGYDREQILTLSFPSDASAASKQTFKQTLQTMAAVRSATLCGWLPGQGAGGNKLVEEFVPKGKNTGFRFITADADFLTTFGIKRRQGRNFTPHAGSGQFDAGSGQFLVNQAMARYLEWGEGGVGKPLGYYTYQYNPDGSYTEVPVKGEVIGVVEDYHQSDLRSLIEPLIIMPSAGNEPQLAVKLQTGDIRNSVLQIGQTWQRFFPGKPFEYRFMDDAFNDTYAKETRTGKVFGMFACLAVFISCLGLFGLVTFIAQTKTKEIGIRKVLGASVGQIVALLSKDFLRLVLLALLIASPVSYYLMHQWLQHFAYKIELSWSIFALAGLLAIAIALVTVSFQAIKAALANPVNSLKTE
jgi:putative ABC transport system permease protein